MRRLLVYPVLAVMALYVQLMNRVARLCYDSSGNPIGRRPAVWRSMLGGWLKLVYFARLVDPTFLRAPK
jgi:hypothetical protein